ncbi:MAG: hypothetical protein K5930_11545 [Treponemataceae bacterium]|nr:hypothetical protein [Treponemataceae bacterium]
MDLGRQWNERIKIWMEKLPGFFFTECGSLPAVFFTTYDFLSMEEAEAVFKGKKGASDLPKIHKALPGTKWGAKWEYAWFKYELRLPQNMAGKRIVCRPDTGAESLVFVNGKAAGAFDKFHYWITLTPKASGGEAFSMLSEVYAGHGIRPENGGPYADGEVPVPEPAEKQVEVGRISWGVWNEEVYQVAMDAFTLYSLLSVMDEKSLRGQKVADALKRFTLIADLELPEKERTASILKAGEVLKAALSCVNGSTAPFMSAFGQSHLDLAWLWPLEETKRKCARTYSNQLSLMEEYPEYRFLACEPYILETIKNLYPDLYSRIVEKIESGQIFCDGAFWVENDTNLPCGEALIRQFVRGRKWFRDNLGKDSKTAWLPDSFGFSGALPQILAGCGIKYFTTQKLLRIDPDCDQFPYNNFYWQGIDGTKILSHIHKKNNAVYTAASLSQRWNNDRKQEENIEGMLFPFGYGDGGGGPTRDMLEAVRRTHNLEGLPKVEYETLTDFFQRLERKEAEDASAASEYGLNPHPQNVYRGELYLSWHRGAYTSQAKTKRYNRLAEVALHNAEFWCALVSASLSDAAEKPCSPRAASYLQQLDGLWQKLLLCQFHDILSGTSIKRVHDEAEKALLEVIHEAGALAESAACSVAGVTEDEDSDSCLILNSLPWERLERVEDKERGKAFWVKLPPCGYVLAPRENGKSVDSDFFADRKGTVSCCTVNENGVVSILLENEYLKVSVDECGRLSSIFDKESGRELSAGLCNNFSMYKDVTPFYDAWELSPMYREAPLALDDTGRVEIVENEKDFVRLRICRDINKSKLEQFIEMRAQSRRIDFVTKIDWQEKHKILKADFPLGIYTDEAICDIQFGFIKRPVHRTRQFDRDRYEVCNHKYTCLTDGSRGVAVLNDCKYGVSLDEGTISLTLLKSPVIPDMYADQGIQEMTYSLYVFNGSFSESEVIKEAYKLNNPPVLIPVSLACAQEDSSAGNENKVPSPNTAHGSRSFFSLDNADIMLETVKQADESHGKTVLRLYETTGKSASCQLRTLLCVKNAYETDMTEKQPVEALKIKDGSIALTFRPFEVKTIVLS